MGQGKKDSQMKHSENFAFWGLLCLIISILLILFIGCIPASKIQEEKTYINIDGEDVEFVTDEYDNPYLKYAIGGKNIYIPFPFETEDEEEPYKGPMLTNYGTHTTTAVLSKE